MHLKVNGERREVADILSLQQLVTHLNLPAGRIAIELNHEVVRRSEWEATILKEDDRVEIVHFVGGGGEHSGQWAEGRRQKAEGRKQKAVPHCPLPTAHCLGSSISAYSGVKSDY